jgi:hypothetical protein
LVERMLTEGTEREPDALCEHQRRSADAMSQSAFNFFSAFAMKFGTTSSKALPVFFK